MASFDPAAQALPNIPGYEVERLVGEGGMGRVYLARQRSLDRPVCIKVLGVNDPGPEPDGELLVRFRREAKLLAMVTHPHILTILDLDTIPGEHRPYLVTEYIENGDLRKLLRGWRPFPVSKARAILSQIGEALRHLHSKGILHRDLKPENILTPTDSLVKVADFGLAVLQSERGELTRTSRGIGTLVYASPEQQNGGAIDARADQYSLAAVAYELLTGKRPVGAFKAPSEVVSGLDPGIDPVLMKALSREPDGRYPELEPFLADLDRALAARDASTRRIKVAAALTAVAAALALMAALYVGGWFGQGGAENVIKSVEGEKVVEPDNLEEGEEFRQLVKYRAEEIWLDQGAPEGAAGEAVSFDNWLNAERQIREEVKLRAYKLWEERGRLKDERGEAERTKNEVDAIRELLKEAEARREVARREREAESESNKLSVDEDRDRDGP